MRLDTEWLKLKHFNQKNHVLDTEVAQAYTFQSTKLDQIQM